MTRNWTKRIDCVVEMKSCSRESKSNFFNVHSTQKQEKGDYYLVSNMGSLQGLSWLIHSDGLLFKRLVPTVDIKMIYLVWEVICLLWYVFGLTLRWQHLLWVRILVKWSKEQQSLTEGSIWRRCNRGSCWQKVRSQYNIKPFPRWLFLPLKVSWMDLLGDTWQFSTILKAEQQESRLRRGMIILQPFQYSCSPLLSDIRKSRWREIISPVRNHPQPELVLKLPVLYFSVVNSQFSNSEFRIDTPLRSDHTWLVLRRMLATNTSSQVTTLLGATGFCPSSTTAGLAIW